MLPVFLLRQGHLGHLVLQLSLVAQFLLAALADPINPIFRGLPKLKLIRLSKQQIKLKKHTFSPLGPIGPKGPGAPGWPGMPLIICHKEREQVTLSLQKYPP